MDLPYWVFVLGYSGSGKTSFIQHLVTTATDAGLRCGVLKTGRSHSPSRTSNDSFLYLQSGALISWFWSRDSLETTTSSSIFNQTSALISGSHTPLPAKEHFLHLLPHQLPDTIQQAFSTLDLFIVEGRRFLPSTEVDPTHDYSTIHLNIPTEKRSTPGLKYALAPKDLTINDFSQFNEIIQRIFSRYSQRQRRR